MFIVDFIASLAYMCMGLVFYILYVVGLWRIFVDMGIEGWKSIIPFYNDYLFAEKTWDVKFILYSWAVTAILFFVRIISGTDGFIGTLFSLIAFVLVVALMVVRARFCYYIAKAFGYDIGFAIGLLFLPFIFTLILAFGGNKYVGNYYKESGAQY